MSQGNRLWNNNYVYHKQKPNLQQNRKKGHLVYVHNINQVFVENLYKYIISWILAFSVLQNPKITDEN